eukprot:217568-Alexandrium_andersonii.AAC.2
MGTALWAEGLAQGGRVVALGEVGQGRPAHRLRGKEIHLLGLAEGDPEGVEVRGREDVVRPIRGAELPTPEHVVVGSGILSCNHLCRYVNQTPGSTPPEYGCKNALTRRGCRRW